MIKKATFTVSNTDYKKCPQTELPEYAFVGRSNVGKSSLINALTNQKNLAKTSQKPGKTQLINHFLIDDTWYLVDLPGYGWASVSKSVRAAFQPMIQAYLLNRANLFCTFLLIDIRHPPQKADLAFMNFLGEQSLPFVILFTKADKLSKQKTEHSIAEYMKELEAIWEVLPEYFITSSTKNVGLDELHKYIISLNQQYHHLQ